MSTKKKRVSVFAVLVVIVLLLLVAATVTANVIFSGDKVPEVAGYYLYMHETEDMAPDIPQNTLVVAKAASETSLAPGNKVLCYLNDGNLALRVIYQITVNEDGSTSYYPGTAVEQGSELIIPRSNIFAICTYQNRLLYKYIKFATSVSGLMALLVLPCIILIIMLLVKIAKKGTDEMEDEEFLFDEEKDKNKKGSENPLFEPGQTPAATESLEWKKSSISEHFEKKPVNENSPYQKAVQERTMKFRIQQQDLENARNQQNNRSAAEHSVGTQVFSTQTVEETARQQETGTQADAVAKPPVSDKKPTEATVQETTAKLDTPNIDDIVNSAELRAAKTGQKVNPEIAATDSIDDLIRVLEKEKKKLD
jgi:hypothetical protein